MFVCGVVMKDRLFIVGGFDWEGMIFNICEVYNEIIDEWYFIVNLNVSLSVLSSMVCCDGKVYVLGGCYDNDLY